MDRSRLPLGRLVAIESARLLALLALAAALPALMIWRRPDMMFDADWLFGEMGNQLYRLDQIRVGRLIFRDFACQYGALPVYAWALVASFFNDPLLASQVFHLALRLAALCFLYGTLRRICPPLPAFLIALIVVWPAIVLYTALGAYQQNESISFEVTLLSALVWLYRPPDERSLPRSLAIGAVLGIWQWVKFGGAFIGGASIVGIDLLWLLATGPQLPRIRRWILGGLAIFAAFASLEALRWAVLYLTCPPEIAYDTGWPAYMLGDYKYALARKVRRIPILPRIVFLTQGLPTLLLAGLGIASLLYDTARRFRDGADRLLGGYLALLFFILGSLAYFKHEFLILQYAWSSTVAGCLVLGRFSWPARAPFFAMGLARLALALKIAALNPIAPDVQTWTSTTGLTLHLNEPSRARRDAIIQGLERARASHPAGMVFHVSDWKGMGVYHLLDQSPATRNPFFVYSGFRPYDDQELRARLDQVAAFYWLSSATIDDAFQQSLTPETLALIRDQFELVPFPSPEAPRATFLIRR